MISTLLVYTIYTHWTSLFAAGSSELQARTGDEPTEWNTEVERRQTDYLELYTKLMLLDLYLHTAL